MNEGKFRTRFLAYSPEVKPLGRNQGGGFTVSIDVSETEWNKIKDLNDPTLKDYELTIIIKGKKISYKN